MPANQIALTIILAILVLTVGCIYSTDREESGPDVDLEPINMTSLKCEPIVKVTGYNYTGDPASVPYQDIHNKFAENYTGSNLSLELRNLTISSMLTQADELGENTNILYESIKVTYNDWETRPYRIPTYAEKAMYNNEQIWAIAFNRANGFEDGLGHFDLFFVSISTIEAQYVSGCKATAVVYQFGCD